MKLTDTTTLASIDTAIGLYAKTAADESHLRAVLELTYAQGVVDGTKSVAAAMRQQQAEMLQV